MGREMGEGGTSGGGGQIWGGGTPEESDGCNDITITGNLPVPRATENNEGFVRNTPPPPKSPDYRSALPPVTRTFIEKPADTQIWTQRTLTHV